MGSFLDFIYHVSPALIGVGLGGAIIQRFFVARANEAALIDYVLKQLDELRSDCLEYWNLDCKKDDRQERAKILEQKIKGAIRSLFSDLRYYSDRYRRNSDFEALMTKLMDVCTGGQFEVSKRDPDVQRYIVIINAVNKVKSELMRQKL